MTRTIEYRVLVELFVEQSSQAVVDATCLQKVFEGGVAGCIYMSFLAEYVFEFLLYSEPPASEFGGDEQIELPQVGVSLLKNGNLLGRNRVVFILDSIQPANCSVLPPHK